MDTFTYYKTEKFLSGYKKISRRLLAARPAAPLGRFSGGGLAPAGFLLKSMKGRVTPQ